MSKYRTWKYWRDEWVNPLVIAIILASVIRIFIIQPFKIPSTSMYPSLKVGDRILVNKFLYGAKIPFTDIRTPRVRLPKTGDVIVFISVTDTVYPSPKENYRRLLGPVFFNIESKRFVWYTQRYIVKRLAALPGEKIAIRDGSVYINGKAMDGPLVMKSNNYFNAGEYAGTSREITVPEGSYFVLGDNSANSIDSRFWGFVPEDNVVGKVFVIWWPLTRIKVIK